MTLDGELYNHALHDDFNTISSVLRKKDPSIADLLRSEELVEYHIYDMPDSDLKFSQRFDRLTELLTDFVYRDLGNSTPLRIVKTVPGRVEDAVDYLEMFMAEGYEGAIARRDLGYENKRSKNLIKVKKFLDEEFQLIGIETGRGSRSNIAARAILQLADGRPFKAGIMATVRSSSTTSSRFVARWRRFNSSTTRLVEFLAVVSSRRFGGPNANLRI